MRTWGVRTLRSIWRSLLLLGLLVAAVMDGQVRKWFSGLAVGAAGAVWVSAWSRRILAALGIDYAVDGLVPAVETHGLAVVSNHLSYLDILVYSAATPMIMVAKSEVRRWPLIGWITAQAGTIYVERADVEGGQRQTHAEVNRMMAEGYRSGLPVLFFPEGTTTDGGAILPFRRGLFHSIVNGGMPLKTAAIAYALDEESRGASVAEDVCYWGEMVFGPHLFRCLGLRGLSARVAFSPQVVAGGDRFALALHAHEQVRALYEGLRCLAAAGSDARQETFTAQAVDHLFDAPVEGFAAVYDQAGMGG